MRVSHQMMIDNIAVNLSKQTQQLFVKQREISSGKRFNQASDDPLAVGKILDYRKSLASIEQYTQNIILGKTRLEHFETVLDEADELLNSAINLATHEAAGNLDTRPVALTEIESLRDQILHMANSKPGENYLFSGHKTKTIPFAHQIEISGAVPGDIVFGLAVDATDVMIEIRDATDSVVRTINLGDGVTPGSGGTAGNNTVAWDGLDDGGTALPDGIYTFTITASDAGMPVVDYETYQGDNGELRIILGENVDLKINADGNTAFTDIFYRLSQVQQGMQNPNAIAGNAQISAALDPLNIAHHQLITVRASGAAKYKQLEAAENQYAKLKLNVENILSATEDVDVTKAIVELQSMETAYETYLAAAARILQPSLINFLK